MPTIVAFIIVFGTIVFFHELGHFLVAKLAGVVVYEFALGFGPRLVHTKKGETVYSIRLLPLGGFVKLAGMDEPESELESIGEQHPGNFNNKPLPVRLATIAAGPFMNFVFAAVILALYSALIFIPPTIVALVPGLPAEQVGLELGDQVVQVNNAPVRDLDQLIGEIEASAGQELHLTIKRDNQLIDVTVIPEVEDGKGIIGVSLNAKQKVPFFQAIINGVAQTWLFVKETVLAIVGMFSGSVEPKLAGPIGIYQMVGVFAAQGIASLMILAAALNINLGLLNLLPIPVLDGGWLVIFIVEALRGRPLKEEHRGIAQLVGLALLLMLMVFATYSDITRLLS